MIRIITDSTCDIPEELLEKYNIIVIPQIVIWGEKQYRDRVDIQPVEFYQRLEMDEDHPHSSQPSLVEFKKVYENAINQGAGELMVLTVSSAMSGTCAMAKKAAEPFDIPITVVDSKGPTMSLGWQVLAAARAIEDGAGLQAALKCVDEVRKKLALFVGMNTLKYLQKGGRIGEAAKWAGTLLKVKPLVTVNHQTGLVTPVGLVRTYKAMVNLLYDKFFERLGNIKNLRVSVLHGNSLDNAEALAERIRTEHKPIELLINNTGPVLGINTGPGALALCGYCD